MQFFKQDADLDIQFAPGTVQLQDSSDKDVTTNLIHSRDGSLVLYPQPTSDPNDPLNWSAWRKTVNFGFACLYTLFVYTILDIGPVAWAVWNEELGFSYDNLSNSFASNTAALAVGCIVLVPLTVKYGRRPIYLATTLVLTLSAVWMALQMTVGDLIGNNILAGLAGSVGDVLVQLTVADLFFIHQRGTMNGIYVFMVNLGAFGAPVATGYIVENQSWPWMFWYCVIFLAITFLAMLFFYEETKFKHAVINSIGQVPQSSQTDASNSVKDKDVSQSLDPQISGSSLPHGEPGINDWIDRSIPMKSYRERHRFVTKTSGTFKRFTRQMLRPFEYFYWFPAVAYNAVQYGAMLSMFSVIGNSQAAIFSVEPYNFGPVGIGLIAIPALIGTMLGGVYGGVMSDWAIIYLSKRNHGIYEPEFRLYMCIPPALIGPAGIYLYGIGSSNGLPWIAPLMGIALFGFSLSSITNLNLVYLYDSYADILGGALVIVSFFRNGFATAIVFAFNPWVAAMGYQNTFILCGSLALFFNLLSVPMIIWGKAWRVRFADKYKYYAALDSYNNLGRS